MDQFSLARRARCVAAPVARTLASFALLVSGLTPLNAQELGIYTANSSNNQLSLINFDATPSGVAVNVDANERKSLRSIVIRDDRAGGANLIVADTLAGEVLLYPDPVVYPALAGRGQLIGSPSIAVGPALPDGLSLNPTGDLFAVSSGTGNASQKTAELWVYAAGCTGSGCRPGGYANPIKLAGPLSINLAPGVPTPKNVTLDLLEETVVATSDSGAIAAGDLLVLSSSPPALVRLPSIGGDPLGGALPAPQVLIYPDSAVGVDARRKFPAGVEPGGFALGPGGRLLVSSSDGKILSYDTEGRRSVAGSGAFVDFASGLGNGKFKVEVALQRGLYRALVADRNGGELLRFDFLADGTGLLSGTVAQGLQFPIAVAATSASVAPTAAGLFVQSSPTRGILSNTFREVDVPGFTSGNVYLVVDPINRSVAGDQSFLLSAVDASLPAISIPATLRGFPFGGPGGAQEAYVVVIQETSAGYIGPISIELDPEPVLLWDPPCTAFLNGTYVPLASRQRAFWGPIGEFGEAPILEGPTVVNVTDGCGSSRGIVREASIFVIGRDLRTAQTQTQQGLATLGSLLNGPNAAGISRGVLRTLLKQYDTAVREFSRGKYVATRDNLLALASTASTVVDAPGRIGPELESRARAAAFAVCSIEQPARTPVCTVP